MKIRTAEDSDFAEWLRLRELLYPEYDSKELMREIKAIYFDRNVAGELDYFVCVVEKADTGLCGFCEISLRETDPNCESGPVGYIESLYVDTKFRMRGLATVMLNEGEKWVKSNVCCDFWVDTEDKYEAALHCYESFGFSVVKKSESDIILHKILR